jgi:hypothetical protein
MILIHDFDDDDDDDDDDGENSRFSVVYVV